jgi:hypothetical protein
MRFHQPDHSKLDAMLRITRPQPLPLNDLKMRCARRESKALSAEHTQEER